MNTIINYPLFMKKKPGLYPYARDEAMALTVLGIVLFLVLLSYTLLFNFLKSF